MTTTPLLLTVTCPDCGHRWTVEVSEGYGPELERTTLCPVCCAETGIDPEL